MVVYRLPIMIFVLALVYIFIAPEEPFIFKLFFKLLPIGVIIFYSFRFAPAEKKAVHWFVIAGLIFSAVGDATLHWFLIGLSAYAIGLLCYMIGFFTIAKINKTRLFALLPIAIYAIGFSLLLSNSLQNSDESDLLLPMIAYTIIISFMLLAAILTGNQQAIIGAVLFIISHSTLAWHLFIHPLALGDAIVMFSYYGAQFFIAVSLYSLIDKRRRIIW